MRTRTLVLLLIGVLLLGGCADAERVVTSRDVVAGEGSGRIYRVSWESEAYGHFVFRTGTSDSQFGKCYDTLMVGEPLPDSCLTKRVLRADTDAFERSPAVAWATTLVAIAGLLWFALRRIAWVPRVAAVTEHRVASPIPDSGSAAIELMRSTDAERESRMEAEADGHDLRHPWWVGLAIGVIPLIVMSLLVGWGTSLSWARRPGLLIFLGLGLISLPMVLGRFQRSDMHPMIMRLQFLGGVSVGMLLLFLTGMGLRGLLLNLNGVAWPF